MLKSLLPYEAKFLITEYILRLSAYKRNLKRNPMPLINNKKSKVIKCHLHDLRCRRKKVEKKRCQYYHRAFVAKLRFDPLEKTSMNGEIICILV